MNSFCAVTSPTVQWILHFQLLKALLVDLCCVLMPYDDAAHLTDSGKKLYDDAVHLTLTDGLKNIRSLSKTMLRVWLVGSRSLGKHFFFFLVALFTHSSFLMLNAFIIACTSFQLVASKMQLGSFGEITFADFWCAVFAVCCRPRSRIPFSKKKKEEEECCLMGSRCKRLFPCWEGWQWRVSSCATTEVSLYVAGAMPGCFL